MNTLERRQIARGQVIDMVVAKTAVTKSRREREDAAKKLRKQGVPDQKVTQIQLTRPEYSGQTFQLLLLPIWVGNYQYQGKTYRVLANGQTGQVAGDRPVDSLKVILMLVLLVAALMPFAIAAFLWLQATGFR